MLSLELAGHNLRNVNFDVKNEKFFRGIFAQRKRILKISNLCLLPRRSYVIIISSPEKSGNRTSIFFLNTELYHLKHY